MPKKATLREVERQVALEHPNLTPEDKAKMIAWRLKQSELHDRLWYRIQASRWLCSAKPKEPFWNADARTDTTVPASTSMNALPGLPTKRQIEFAARVYTIQSGDRRILIKVIRRGRNQKQIVFRYATVNGVAKKNTHFLPKSETLRFEPGESEKELSIELMDGAEWKSRDVFYVHLELDENDSKTELGMCKVAEIMYPDQSLGVMPGASTVEFVKNHEVAQLVLSKY
jgi:solute carrier family 8 (sodium/calcium exchanger)